MDLEPLSGDFQSCTAVVNQRYEGGIDILSNISVLRAYRGSTVKSHVLGGGGSKGSKSVTLSVVSHCPGPEWGLCRVAWCLGR